MKPNQLHDLLTHEGNRRRTGLDYCLRYDNKDILAIILGYVCAVCTKTNDIQVFKDIFPYACALDTTDIVETIVNISSKNEWNLTDLLEARTHRTDQTPLHVACDNNNIDMFLLILNTAENIEGKAMRKMLKAHDKTQQTPLHRACQRGNSQIVSIILDNLKTHELVEKIIKKKDENDFTVLHLSQMSTNATAVTYNLMSGLENLEKKFKKSKQESPDWLKWLRY